MVDPVIVLAVFFVAGGIVMKVILNKSAKDYANDSDKDIIDNGDGTGFIL